MARSTSMQRRLAASVPIAPPPPPVYNPAVQEGPTGGRLENIQPQPLIDVRTPPVMEAPAGGGARDVLSRALVGFNRGASQFKIDPTYDPVAAGLAGGISAIGAGEADAMSRRLAAQRPYQEAEAEALKEAAKRQAADPFEAVQQSRMLEREKQLAGEKSRLNREFVTSSTSGLKPADALAINKQAQQDVLLRGVDPSSDQFGDAVAARVAELAQQAKSLGASKVSVPLPKGGSAKPAGRPSLTDIFK